MMMKIITIMITMMIIRIIEFKKNVYTSIKTNISY
jgi:hypothetical protein